MIYVNPDDYLGHPRNFTEERNRRAWDTCRDLIETTLHNATKPHIFYIVCGVPGAGKTRWIKESGGRFLEPAIVLDAALPRICDRAKPIAQAQRFSCRLIAIRIRCPLELALVRNRARPADQVVPDEVVRLNYADFEAPSLREGFNEVFTIDTAALPAGY